ncbi:hypothetical protein RQP46_004028 [Phenoliferia psychrophenolica]
MQQDELSKLLEELRRTQDPRPPTDAPPAPSFSPSDDPSSSTQTLPISIPTQAQLDSLLSSLTNPPPPPPPPERDLTTLSFAESLPILQELGGDPDFLEALGEIKEEQADEELRMKDERNRLESEGKRGAVSQHVQNSRLRDWDRKALVRWKGVREIQQAQLQEMGVPSFFPTEDPTALRKQARVMAVLVGFLDD